MSVTARPVLFPAGQAADLDGRPVAVDALWHGAGALLLVGHSECETTRLALRFADRLHRRRRTARAVAALLQDEPAEARALVSELDLALPVLADPHPYALTTTLRLTTVPTLFLLDGAGHVQESWEAFRRADFERLAIVFGVEAPFFAPHDTVPALRPG